MDREHLRTGDRALCHFRFIKNPEYILPGTKMIFREGRTKAVGTITKLFHETPGQSSHNTRTGKSTKAQMHQRAQQANRSRNGERKVPNLPQASSSSTTVKQPTSSTSLKQSSSNANGTVVENATLSNASLRTAET